MQASDKLSIDTPEQIAIEFPLAGIGSRFLALAIDTLLQVTVLLMVLLAGFAVRRWTGVRLPGASSWILAIGVALLFLLYSAYFAVFEVIWKGQTPGKRHVGLRVIDASGAQLTVFPAILRNLLRPIDQFPGIYAVAILSVIVSPRQQRLGDLAAGTVVVHERVTSPRTVRPAAAPEAVLGVQRLAPADIALVESFLRRRDDLDSFIRLTTARRIAERIALKLDLGPVEHEERLLEHVVAEYRGRRG